MKIICKYIITILFVSMQLLMLDIKISYAKNHLLSALNNLPSKNYSVQYWCIMPDKDIVALLFYSDWSNFRRFYSYAKINNNKEFVISHDSISGPLMVPIEGIVFDSTGNLFMYHNPGMSQRHQMVLYEYDPRIKRIEKKEYPPPWLGVIKSADHIPGIGNVMFNMMFGHDKPYKIVIDNPETGQVQSFDLDFINGYLYFESWIKIHKLSPTKILLIGVIFSNPKHGFMISKMIYDLQKQGVISAEIISYDDLRESGVVEFESPEMEKTQLFEKDGKLFYLAFGEKTKDTSTKNRHALIVEFNHDGEIVLDEGKTALKIEEAVLSETPDDFILLYNISSKVKKFWMVSLDNFPTLVIDKGE